MSERPTDIPGNETHEAGGLAFFSGCLFALPWSLLLWLAGAAFGNIVVSKILWGIL